MYSRYNLACIIMDLNNSVKPKSIHNRYKAWEKSCGWNFLCSWFQIWINMRLWQGGMTVPGDPASPSPPMWCQKTQNIGEIKSTSSATRWEECQQFDNFIYISCRGGVNHSAFVSRIQNLSEAPKSILKILHFRDSFPVNILSLIKKQEIVAEDFFLISQ